MLSILKKSTQSLFKRRVFCFSNKSLFDRAYLSSIILRKISETPQQTINSKIQIQSLKDQILEQINKAQVSQDAKIQISKIFKQGITINKNVWQGQQRITKGTVRYQKQNDDNIYLYSFNPTYLVTKQIINSVLTATQLRSKRILSSYFGISKTFSFMLFSTLSDYIIKYRIKTYKKLSTQQLLQQQNKILKTIPKLVYLTVNIDPFDEYHLQIEKLIQQQTADVKNALKKQFQQYGKQNVKFTSLKNMYQYFGIQVILIVDQINRIASAIRQYNAAVELKNEIFKKPPKQNNTPIHQLFLEQLINVSTLQWKDIKQQYYQAQKILSIILKKMRQFHTTIYLSSIKIENYLIYLMNLNGQIYHQKIKTMQVFFTQLYYNNKARYQIADIFLFQFEERILKFSSYKNFHQICNLDFNNKQRQLQIQKDQQKSLNMQSQQTKPTTSMESLPLKAKAIQQQSQIIKNLLRHKKQIRQQIVKRLQQDSTIFLTPLLIRQSLQQFIQKQKLNLLNRLQTMTDIKKQAFQIFQECCQLSKNNLSNKVQQFLDKKILVIVKEIHQRFNYIFRLENHQISFNNIKVNNLINK